MTSRLRVAALGRAAVVAACGSTGSPTPIPQSLRRRPAPAAPPILPIPITSAFRVGENRIVFGLLDSTGQKPVAAPDRTLRSRYHGPNGETIAPAPPTFIWAIEGEQRRLRRPRDLPDGRHVDGRLHDGRTRARPPRR